MGADSTLVSASFREAMSRAGANVPNLKPLYDSSVKQVKQATDMITGFMDNYSKKKEALKIGKDKQLQGFKKVLEQNYAKLFVQKETMPQKIVDAVDREVRRLQDEFEAVNTFGKNDTAENERARTRLTASLQRVVNQAIQARATFTKLGDNTREWNDGAIKENVIAPLTKMMDLKNVDKDPDTFVDFVDGELTFAARNYHDIYGHTEPVDPKIEFINQFDDHGKRQPGDMVIEPPTETIVGKWGDIVSFNLSQMEELIPEINIELDTHAVETLNTFTTQGVNDASLGEKAYNKVDFEREFSREIKTPEDFRNLALRRIPDINVPSLKSALQKDFGMAKELLEVMFDEETLNRMDTDKSGDISLDDAKGLSGEDLEMFEANFDTMINALTDIGDPNFNLERSKKLLIDYYGFHSEERYNSAFDTKFKQLNALKKKDETKGLTLSYGYRTWAQMQSYYDDIKSGKDVIKGGDGTIWNRQLDGRYKINNGETIYTRNQLKDHFELNHLDDFEGASSENVDNPLIGKSGFRFKDYEQINGEWFFVRGGKSEKVMSSTTKEQLNQIYVPKK